MADYKLNTKQRRFANEYIISGNATQSAITAGYSEKTAYSQGNRLLKHDEVRKFIKDRTEELWNEKTMTVSEALALSASIARGEPQKGYSKSINKITGEVEKEIEYIYTPSAEDRQRSLDHIFKVSGSYLERQQIDANINTDPLEDLINHYKGDD